MPEPLRVLIVDDDPVDVLAAERAMRRLPRELAIETAGDEATALSRARAMCPDLVFLDMQLGAHRGEEVVDALRQAGCDAGVILLTGTSDPERVAAGMRAGALDYLPKSALATERIEEVVRFATRVVQAERDLVRARLLTQRRGRQLARLAEASVDVATKPDLHGVVESVHEAAEEIFEAQIDLKLDRHGDTLVTRGPRAPLGAELLTLDLSGAVAGVRGQLLIGRDAPFDDSERLVALQLARICVTGADKLLLLGEAQESARERQEIVAIVSHDLRTPLQSLSLGVDSIGLRLEGHRENATLAPTLDRMRRSIGTMSRLLGDLLDVSRIHDGAIPVRPGVVDPAALVHDAREQHLPIAQKKGLELHEVLGHGSLVCDGGRIAQALSNLVSNALRHTERGAITIRSIVTESLVRFEVEDTGPGVPEAIRERLFERLFQAEDAGRRTGGLGLGLFIVKGIVDAHYGRVGLTSVVGQGSVFFFELPTRGLATPRHGIATPDHVSGAQGISTKVQ